MNTNRSPGWGGNSRPPFVLEDAIRSQQINPATVAITINVHAAKPSVLLIAAAWVITLSVAIVAVGIIVEKTLIWTALSTEEDAKPSVSVKSRTPNRSTRRKGDLLFGLVHASDRQGSMNFLCCKPLLLDPRPLPAALSPTVGTRVLPISVFGSRVVLATDSRRSQHDAGGR